MSQIAAANLVFFLIAFAWIVYLLQEAFIAGASALNVSLSRDEVERRQIQVTTGLHFDGMEVWLIAALTMTFGGFPLAFAESLSSLYIMFYLFLYALIARGVSIEIIYKMDNARYVKTMVYAWMISSILIVVFLGIYITNLFTGLPEAVNGSIPFFSLFHVTTIIGGLLFFVVSLLAGSAWLEFTTVGDIGKRALSMMRKTGMIFLLPILILFVYMGINNTSSSIFIGELFGANPILFVLPALSVLAALGTSYFGWKEDAKGVFITVLIAFGFFLLTGFVGMFPYMVPVRDNLSAGITIEQAMSSLKSLNIIIIAVLIFFPIIIGYQSWKYVHFKDKIKPNDE